MRCNEIMRPKIECLSANDSVQAAAKRMREANVSLLPVCNDERNVLGTVTDRDLVTRVVAEALPPSTRVHEVMTSEVVACRPEDDIRTAERIMSESRTAQIVVLDQMQRLSGLISLSDLASYEDASLLGRTYREITGTDCSPR